MGLSELLVLLKEARVLDDQLTAREVCTMLVKVSESATRAELAHLNPNPNPNPNPTPSPSPNPN